MKAKINKVKTLNGMYPKVIEVTKRIIFLIMEMCLNILLI